MMFIDEPERRLTSPPHSGFNAGHALAELKNFRRHSGRREAAIRNPVTHAELVSGFRVRAFGALRNDALKELFSTLLESKRLQ
jgi:hypothetical protein